MTLVVDEKEKIPDFETRGVLVKELKGEYLAYGILFKTAKDRTKFINKALKI